MRSVKQKNKFNNKPNDKFLIINLSLGLNNKKYSNKKTEKIL